MDHIRENTGTLKMFKTRWHLRRAAINMQTQFSTFIPYGNKD
jgi:hypothetical protein